MKNQVALFEMLLKAFEATPAVILPPESEVSAVGPRDSTVPGGALPNPIRGHRGPTITAGTVPNPIFPFGEAAEARNFNWASVACRESAPRTSLTTTSMA